MATRREVSDEEAGGKITLSDLAALLAAQQQITKQDAEFFLKELFTLAGNRISRGEPVRINGLGVFKPVWVASRTSVNVRTGEPYEIPGHYKLGFTPDKAVREAVNAPFACFEATELPDGTDLSREEEAVVAEILEDSGVAVPVPEPVTEVSGAEPSGTPTPGGEPEQAAAPRSVPEGKPCPERKGRQIRNWGFVLLSLACLMVASGIVFEIVTGRSLIGEWLEPAPAYRPAPNAPKTAEVVKALPVDTPAVAEQPETVSAIEPEPVEPVAEVPEQHETELQDADYPAQAVETVRPGVFLTKLALHYFGNKIFWVYIYLENESELGNPDQIPAGTQVRIPARKKYPIDPDDPQSIEKAKALKDTIMSRFR